MDGPIAGGNGARPAARLGPPLEPPEPPPRFLRSMPLPLMVLFLLLGAAAVALVAWLLVRPPNVEPQPVEARRPPPAEPLSHDVLRLRPAPGALAGIAPPCPAFDDVRVAGGAPAVRRITAALRSLCQLTATPKTPDVEIARAGIRGSTVRIAAVFGRTGVESTADLRARTIWLNIKFARPDLPPSQLAPVIAHEAFHLGRASATIDAAEELRARAVELTACRELIPREFWLRGCEEAEELLGLGRERAVAQLVRAGYAP